MNSFQEKKSDFRKLVESWPMLVIFCILLVFFAVNIILFIGKMVEARKSREIAQSKVDELTLKKEQLNVEIESLNTEKGKEALIREKFGLAKEGEGMVVVINDKNTENLENTEEKKSLLYMFFSNLFR